MPRGQYLKSLMENQEVECMYYCIKHAQDIDYDGVAKQLGLKNGSAAKERLKRVMKAQEKGAGLAGATAPQATNGMNGAADGEKRGKKRKMSVKAESDEEAAEDEKRAKTEDDTCEENGTADGGEATAAAENGDDGAEEEN